MRPFILIALLAAGILVADTSQAEDPPALPACDAKEAIESVKETIANNAFKNLADVKVLDYDKLSEVSFDAKEGVRVCVGDFVLNTGDETIAYSFRQAKSDPSKILVQVEALDAIQTYRVRAAAEQHNETPEQKAQESAPAPSCDSPNVRSYLSKISPQDNYLEDGIVHMQNQLGWFGKKYHYELGSEYRQENYDANNNQRDCAVSINLCFELETGEKCGLTEGHYEITKTGTEVSIHYSPRTDLEFKPAAAIALPEQAASPALIETSPAQSGPSDNLCGAPYPCRLQTIIDHSDWESVLSALTFAMQTNVKTQVKWSSKVNNHKGYVQQSVQGTAAPNCKVFKISSVMGSDTGTDNITACQQAGGAMTFK